MSKYKAEKPQELVPPVLKINLAFYLRLDSNYIEVFQFSHFFGAIPGLCYISVQLLGFSIFVAILPSYLYTKRL